MQLDWQQRDAVFAKRWGPRVMLDVRGRVSRTRPSGHCVRTKQMALGDVVIVFFSVNIVLGIVAWVQGTETFSKDPWYFPLIAALILQILGSK